MLGLRRWWRSLVLARGISSFVELLRRVCRWVEEETREGPGVLMVLMERVFIEMQGWAGLATAGRE